MGDTTRLIDITVADLEGIVQKVVAKEVEQRLQTLAVVNEKPPVEIEHSQKEAAKKLGISATTLIRYTRKGVLKDTVRWNGQRRYEYDIERCRELIYKHQAQ